MYEAREDFDENSVLRDIHDTEGMLYLLREAVRTCHDPMKRQKLEQQVQDHVDHIKLLYMRLDLLRVRNARYAPR